MGSKTPDIKEPTHRVGFSKEELCFSLFKFGMCLWVHTRMCRYVCQRTTSGVTCPQTANAIHLAFYFKIETETIY